MKSVEVKMKSFLIYILVLKLLASSFPIEVASKISTAVSIVISIMSSADGPILEFDSNRIINFPFLGEIGRLDCTVAN